MAKRRKGPQSAPKKPTQGAVISELVALTGVPDYTLLPQMMQTLMRAVQAPLQAVTVVWNPLVQQPPVVIHRLPPMAEGFSQADRMLRLGGEQLKAEALRHARAEGREEQAKTSESGQGMASPAPMPGQATEEEVIKENELEE